jgi:hypothetical protein
MCCDDNFFSVCQKMGGNGKERVQTNFISNVSTGNMKLCCWAGVLAWRKSCPIATLPTTNPTPIRLDSNPDLHSDRPVTNHLSHVTAIKTQEINCSFYLRLSSTP